ncbi:FAD-binding domain-containing protein [Aulographum hederae CBS 113979]|uniref:FAD-binding domain-containing protein n=1 Tax=Aulographum hederae CBS 113979 TaxID=1176131 RepID=A0A6G1H7B9_9PEZI|nr:FAD-binding domain-containing protein [Aulographum hederae CBS 113979]
MKLYTFCAASVILAACVQGAPQMPITERDLDLEKRQDDERGCCEAVFYRKPTIVFYPDDNRTRTYYDAINSFWSLQESDVRPTCVVRPTTALETSEVISILSTANFANTTACKFAVKSGGHTFYAGSANLQDGITIDLALLKDLSISEDKTSVSIGTGWRWGDVHKRLEAEGLATLGGRDSSVGIGGFFLGGGISFFSPKHGFACDAVLDYEVITSEGSVIHANANENQRLFRALKGGSSNFGIVTTFTLPAFPMNGIWGGMVYHSADPAARARNFAFFDKFTTNPEYDENAAFIHSYAYVAPVGWLSVSQVEYTAPVANPPIYQEFMNGSFPLLNTVRIANVSALTDEISRTNPSGRRQIMSAMTFKSNAAFMERFFQLGDQFIKSLSFDLSGLVLSYSFQPIPQAIIQKQFSRSNPEGNVMGLSAESGNVVNVNLAVGGFAAENEAEMNAATRKWIESAEAEARAQGVLSDYIYLNYAAEWQKPLEGYGEKSMAFMRDVAGEFDGRRLYQDGLPGGFKLGI